MGDFAGAVLKYLRRHPIPRLSVVGGVAKLSKLGDGHLVLFHVTGNSDWSNLPMSGLFVDMLRRTGELSSLSSNPDRGEPSTAENKDASCPSCANSSTRSVW